MEQTEFRIISNEKIAKNTYKMVLAGSTDAIRKPGQFVNIKIDGFFLRRPISVCDCADGTLIIIYKVVGSGTLEMSRMQKGMKLDILTGLGNGFDTSKSGQSPLLIGGGVGVPPLYMLCKTLIAEGKNPMVILGFNTKEDALCIDDFMRLGVRTKVTTVDGSLGMKGFVVDAMKDEEYTYFYTCGPMPMLRAVNETATTDGQFSFEEKMGCGFGACMGCSCKTKYGNKRICKDGPVLERGEIIW